MTVESALKSAAYECMGAKIAYRRGGAGPTMLFLRSGDALPHDEAFIQALTRHYDVIVPDLPGFGASDTPEWFRSVGDLANFCLELITALDLQHTHVAGASTGGWVAAETAIRDCSRMASLTLLAPLGVRATGKTFGDPFLMKPGDDLRARFFDKTFADDFLNRQHSKEEGAAILKDKYALARIGWAPRFHNPELQRWLHRIRCPIQLIWGEDDIIAPPAMAQAWLEAIPGAKLETISHCGHLPHIEQREQTLALLSRFTAANSGQRSSG